MAWAFSCARSLKDEKTRSVLGDLQNLQKRFDARESELDDLKQIAVLKKRVASADQRGRQHVCPMRRMELELENERRNDQISGALSMNAVAAKTGGGATKLKRAHYQPPGARAARVGGARRRGGARAGRLAGAADGRHERGRGGHPLLPPTPRRVLPRG